MTGIEHPAANVARNATHGSYNDWFLPSKDELIQMYVNLVSHGVGGFVDGYWSSSEIDNSYAWTLHFPTGSQDNSPKQFDGCRVRAVRAF